MAQVAFIKLDRKWKSVESAISTEKGSTFTFDNTKTYQIECRGRGNAFLLEATSKPSNKKSDGIMVNKDGTKIIEYKKGSNTLYAKSEDVSYLNISVQGE